MHISTLLFRRVGDSLLATPALRAVRQHYPGATLSVITEPQTARVFAGNPSVTELVVVDSAPSVLKLAMAIRHAGSPDITIDFHSDPRSAVACFLSGGRERIGFSYPLRRHLYTRSAPLQDSDAPVYSALHKLRLLAALSIHEHDVQTEFYLSQQDVEFAEMMWRERGWRDAPIVALFIHSRRDNKRWPLKYYAAVIESLRRQDHFVPMILSTPGDETAVEMLAMLAGLDDSQIMELRDLGHLGAVLARCALLIGNDGGPKHLAVALGTPTVTIFRDERPEYWTPPDSQRHLAVAAPLGESIAAIQPSAVIHAVETLLPAVAK